MKKKIQTQIQQNAQSEVTQEELAFRPTSFLEYYGQTTVKERIQTSINAAKIRNTTLDHVLLYGPPGLGKTTIAYIIANEMNCKLHYISGPSIEKAGDIVAPLSQLSDGDILFIDEIHRMNYAAEEVLYSAMEDCFVNITIGREEQSKQVKVSLPKFTLIGATTRPGMLSHPLRDRFGIHCRLEYYSPLELTQIIRRTSLKEGISIDEEGCMVIAGASRGTPRIANRNVARVRDYLLANDMQANTYNIQQALQMYGIHQNGLNDTDLAILNVLNKKEKAVGLETLASLTGEDVSTIEHIYEPYLLKMGYIEKTSKGRIISNKGKEIIELRD